jgi:signal transduction histidine kinase
VKVSVKDNGKGIHPEDIPKLFKINEEFSTKGTNNESGTGLGLILCKELITQCKGEIQVDSKPGIGSNFTFVLPLESVQ